MFVYILNINSLIISFWYIKYLNKGDLNKTLLYKDKEKLNQLLEKAKELKNKLKDAKLKDIKEDLKNLTSIEPIVDEIKDMFNGTKLFELSKLALINALEDLIFLLT